MKLFLFVGRGDSLAGTTCLRAISSWGLFGASVIRLFYYHWSAGPSALPLSGLPWQEYWSGFCILRDLMIRDYNNITACGQFFSMAQAAVNGSFIFSLNSCMYATFFPPAILPSQSWCQESSAVRSGCPQEVSSFEQQNPQVLKGSELRSQVQ